MVVSKKFDDLLGMLGAIVFFLVIVILVMAPFIMIPALFALVFQVNRVFKGVLEFLVLWWFYSTLMHPTSYAFWASIVVMIMTTVTEPILDRAIERQKHAPNQP